MYMAIEHILREQYLSYILRVRLQSMNTLIVLLCISIITCRYLISVLQLDAQVPNKLG